MGGSGCQQVINNLGWTHDHVIVVRSAMDVLFEYYFNDDMASYFQSFDPALYLTDAETYSPGMWDKVRTGEWGIKVTKDSSLLIVKDVNGDASAENVVYCWNRNDEPLQ